MMAWALTEIEKKTKECDELWLRCIESEGYAHDAGERLRELLIKQHTYGRFMCGEAERRLHADDKRHKQ